MSFLCGCNFCVCLLIFSKGPIANLSENGAEIVRVFACSTKLTYNLTKTRFDLITKPFQNTIRAMKGDVKDVEDAFSNIKNVLEPLRNEVEGLEVVPKEELSDYKNTTITDKALESSKNGTLNKQESRNKSKISALTHNRHMKFMNHNRKNMRFNDTRTLKNRNLKITKTKRNKWRYRRQSSGERAVEIQQQYAKKFENRCKFQLAKGEERCKAAFRKAHDACNEKFPRIIKLLLCWPFRADFICNFKILGDPETICDPTEALPNSFGESYQELEETEAQLYKKDKDLEVNYKIQYMEIPPGLK